MKFKTNLQLFLTMLKIGFFTFGGGYAMIALLEHEFVTKKKWLEQEEFLDCRDCRVNARTDCHQRGYIHWLP